MLAALAAAGCRSGGGVSAGSPAPAVSPIVGKWSGKSEVKGGDLQKLANSAAGGPLTGPSSMTLNSGGTGFLKVADRPEVPISWKEEGDRLILSLRGADGDGASSPSTNGPWVAKWSSADRTWTIDMEKVKVILNHHEVP
jgi:hypothetical protein